MVGLTAEEEEETDTFDNGGGRNSVSLSAQLADIRIRFGIRNTNPKNMANSPGKDRVFRLELPPPSRLRQLLGVYFVEMGSFFPFLDQHDTETRISGTLHHLGYSEQDTVVEVDRSVHSIMAVLCNLMVLGECHEPRVDSHESARQGLAMFNQGRKLLQHCTSAQIVDMDLIRYHILSALYMLDSELLQSASYAISAAVQSAMVMRLNDQSLWGDSTSSEKTTRQKLWWTIYCLDRRISQRNGTPYLVRDLDIAVDVFASRSTPHSNNTGPPDAAQGPDRWDPRSEEYYTANHYQSMIDFARLWGYVWDRFYSASAPKCVDWKRIA